MRTLGDFLALFASVLCQMARHLPHHGSKNDSKTHPKSSHDKFKTASKWVKHKAVFGRLEVFAVLLSVPERVVRERMFRRAGKKEGTSDSFQIRMGTLQCEKNDCQTLQYKEPI